MKTGFRAWAVVLSLSLLLAVLAWPARAQVFPIATNQTVSELAGGVVFGGTDYLVGMLSGTNLIGQRFSGDGELVGPEIVLGANPGFPPAVAMAGAETNCLVVWSDYSTPSGVTMFGQLCSTSGGLLGSSFPLLTMAGGHGFQAVQAAASDGTNFLVVWRDSASTSFYGQVVTGQGTLSGPEFLLFTLSDGGGDKNMAVTFGQTNYLIVWQDGTNNTNHTYSKLVSPSGIAGSAIQLDSTGSLDRNPAAAAFDGTNYLVVWNSDTNYSSAGWPLWNLCGRLVSQSGVALGNELKLVEEEASFPALAFDGCNYLLAWGYNTTTTNTEVTIHARFLDRSASPIGPIITPFSQQGTHPPLLPLNGVVFDGSKFVLIATYGSFIMNEMGDVAGFSGGDVYGVFLPGSTTPPVFTDPSLLSGKFQGQLRVVPGQTYTIELSTNLVSWIPAGLVSSDASEYINMVDEEGVAGSSRLFYRAAVGNTLGVSHDFRFLLFANAGGFGGGYTPSPSFPVTVDSYSAALDVDNDIAFPAPTDVYFTGPTNSGLSNAAADPDNSNIGPDHATYQSPFVLSPPIPPGGAWAVSYKGVTDTFDVADPQAASRLVIPLPTVTVSGDVLQSVNWVYRDAATGAALGSVPAQVTAVQVQVEGIVGGRIYDSPEIAPSVTSHALTSLVNWSNVRQMHLAYNDTLGNHYVVSFSKP